jgi:hypothetical protein
MMFIKEIHRLSDPPEDFTISDGNYSVVAFGHPSNYQEGDIIKAPLYAFEPQFVLRGTSEDVSVTPDTASMGYHICGQLTDRKNGNVKVGELLFELNPEFIPNDIGEGEFIWFRCDRLDLH